MGRGRKSNTNSIDSCLLILILPVALLAAFPILWIPFSIFLIYCFAKMINDIHESIEDFKRVRAQNKLAKELEKEYSPKNLLKRNKKKSNIIRNNICIINSSNNDNKTNNTQNNRGVVIENITNKKMNKTDIFNEVLRLCSEIESKLDDMDYNYNPGELVDDAYSLYVELEVYRDYIDRYRDKKLSDLNDELLEEVRLCYDNFMLLYYEFDEIEVKEVDEEEIPEEDNSFHPENFLVPGAIGYSLYKRHKENEEEKERDAYREELRNTWGLTEYEIDLVESGEYEPCQFSEDEVEEDDYYSEDDV